MRMLLAMFVMMALAFAPVASPAVAASTADHCAAMGNTGHHGSDQKGAIKDKSCCAAAAATVPPKVIAPTSFTAAVGATPLPAPQLAPGRTDVEVPPPRS
jgi:hypothetical protein